MPASHKHRAESRGKKKKEIRASEVSVYLGWWSRGECRGERVSPMLQVHWTLPTTSVQHGPDLWADDRSATSRISWPSLAPCPSHTSASHPASGIS